MISLLLLYPVFLIHGIGGKSSDLLDLKYSLESQGVIVYNLEIGNGGLDSVFWNMNKQCSEFAYNVDKVAGPYNKINILGISQGGLIGRCYVEKYSHLIKPVHSLITYGTPHMGIYLNWIDLGVLDYWKNPLKYQNYLETNDFLKYINNDVDHTMKDLYRHNMENLSYFLIVWSNIDTVVYPLESTKFEYYNITDAINHNKWSIVPLIKSSIYSDNTIGLKTLDTRGKLLVKQYNCLHEEFKSPSCFLKKMSNQNHTLFNLTLRLLIPFIS